MKPKYPKLLPLKAKRFYVEDDQAKMAWNYTKLLALIMMAEEDFEFQNLQFETRLRAIGALNKILANLSIMSEEEKSKLANS